MKSKGDARCVETPILDGEVRGICLSERDIRKAFLPPRDAEHRLGKVDAQDLFRYLSERERLGPRPGSDIEGPRARLDQ